MTVEWALQRLRELRENPRVLIQELSGVKVPHMELSDLLAVIFNWVSVPIKLDELVALVADLLELALRARAGDIDHPRRELI